VPRRLPIYAALIYVIVAWSLNTIFAKQVVDRLDPLAFAFLRFAMMTPLAFILAHIGGRRVHVERRDIPSLLLCGACGFGAYQYFWMLGLARTTPFATALLGATAPIFTLAIVSMLGHERVRSGRWLGVGIAFAGIAIFEGAFSGASRIRIGDLLVLGSALVFSIYNVLGARLLARYAPLELLALTMTVGTLMLLPLGLPALLHANLHLGWDVWWRIIFATLFPVLLTYPVWTYNINKLGTGKGSIFGFLVPVLTGVLSVPLLHASFAAYELIGAIVCLSGMLLAYTLGNLSFASRVTAWFARGSG
jgi:drug/metabolite transporter (DMT)-like permease